MRPSRARGNRTRLSTMRDQTSSAGSSRSNDSGVSVTPTGNSPAAWVIRGDGVNVAGLFNGADFDAPGVVCSGW